MGVPGVAPAALVVHVALGPPAGVLVGVGPAYAWPLGVAAGPMAAVLVGAGHLAWAGAMLEGRCTADSERKGHALWSVPCWGGVV